MQAAINFGPVFLLVSAIPLWHLCPVEDQNSAKDLLERVLKRQRSVDYLHIETRSFGSGAERAEVKVQTVNGKGIMVTMLNQVIALEL